MRKVFARTSLLIIFIIFSFGFCSTQVKAETVTINASADTYVYNALPSENYGTEIDLDVGADYSGADIWRTLIKFSISLPTGSAIISAKLYLYNVYHFWTTTHTAHKQTADWDETTVNWTTQPSFAPTATDTITVSGVGWWYWNVTQDVPASGTVGWTIKVVEEEILDGDVNTFSSREALSNKPYLEVTYKVSPTYSLNSTNSTLAGTPVSHNLYWEDNVGLSGYIFSFDNCTGTLANDTWTSMTGTGNWSNVTKTINSTVGCTIKWCVYANDTSNDWNGTSCIIPFSYVTTELKANGEFCLENSECASNSCKPDYEETGKWCCDSSQCAHDGTCYNHGSYSGNYYCNNGSWWGIVEEYYRLNIRRKKFQTNFTLS